MEDKSLPTTIKEWHTAIATETNTSEENVVSLLETHGIKPQPVLPRARTLNIHAVFIEGLKCAKEQTERFDFKWTELNDGVWALLSEGNSKGKSSIISTIRAALQGRFPGKIKRDVWSWMDFIKVEFSIDHVPYSVSIQKAAGETDPTKATASLLRHTKDLVVHLYQGSAGEELKEAMEDLFMDELGFDHFHAYKSAKDVMVEHGWPAMSSALFITGAGPAIFGDHTEDGLPMRLIQLFIGLPWVSTYTAVSTALKRAKNTLEKATAQTASAQAKAALRMAELNRQLTERRAELANQPDRVTLRSELNRLDSLLSQAQLGVTACRNKLAATRAVAHESENSYSDARRQLQQAQDEAAAGYVFRKLKPSCCPACETGFTPGRFGTTEQSTCGLCGNPSLHENDDSETDVIALDAAVGDARTMRKTAYETVHIAEASLEKAETERSQYLLKIQEVGNALSESDQSESLRLDIAVLEGRLAELDVTTTDGQVATEAPSMESLQILKAAEKLTKAMMEELQAEIMAELEAEVFGMTERFGVRNLEAFCFKAHKMVLKQGGVETTFTGLNDGENLRMRVATALATLKVARSRGFGRHPGLLVLDSPAATEMSPEDFTALIGAVSKTVREIPGIQVLVGAVLRPELELVIPTTHRKVALGAAGLF